MAHKEIEQKKRNVITKHEEETSSGPKIKREVAFQCLERSLVDVISGQQKEGVCVSEL